ncbi:MAG: TrkH family potassium uptake protein [Candidatus Enterenecus sp.]
MRRRIANYPARILALSFGGIILVGTLLLLLPISSRSGESCGLLTALFTATSATCVTGLAVVDTLTAWAPFGQAVILLMIQLGGLGFMTLIFYLGTMMRRKPSLAQRLIMVSTFNLNNMGDTARFVKHALKVTLVFEGAGAMILTLCFIPQYGPTAIWKGIFTAVSAFCNAGFDLFGPGGAGSLSAYSRNPVVLLTVCVLVVGGGLGFFVWEELLSKRSYRKLSLYSRMVLWMTGVMILFGWILFFCTEHFNGDTLGSMPVWQQILNALFQSVTLRTAGFTTIDQGALADVSKVISILYMIVGGSSGSTAGGVKTVTIGVLLLALRAGLRGRECVTVRGRTIPQQKVLSALTLVLVMGGMLLICSVLIALADGIPYLTAAYEAASALGTVGLSTGITSELSLFSRLLLIAMMYLGRVGILSFSVAFMGQSGGKNKIRYPETMVMIG